MPFYTFKCRTCGLEKEEIRNMNDFKEPLCPNCCYNPNVNDDGEKMTRVFTNVGKPKFKGSGFYETDYKDKK